MFSFFKKNKGPFNAKIMPLGKTISVKGGSSENLLKVALENGVNWPYNCRVGSCGSCKCKLVSGNIKPLNDFSYVLNGDELDQGYILACQTMLRSDIEVEVNIPNDGVELAKTRRVEGRISRVAKLTHDILDVGVELDGTFSDYLPGQYADLTIPSVIEQARSYSFSQAPTFEKPNSVSFFIRRVPNGQLTEWLHSGDRVGNRITLDGPHGSFYLRDAASSLLLMAGGSGLAPIRALMQQFIDEKRKGNVTLIFGARTRQDLYCLDEIENFSRQLNGRFKFLPVLSQENGSDGWNGATGHCPEAISNDMLDGKSGQAYLCGPPAMIDAAVARLKALGLNDSQIFFDKFLDASSMPGGRA